MSILTRRLGVALEREFRILLWVDSILCMPVTVSLFSLRPSPPTQHTVLHRMPAAECLLWFVIVHTPCILHYTATTSRSFYKLLDKRELRGSSLARRSIDIFVTNASDCNCSKTILWLYDSTAHTLTHHSIHSILIANEIKTIDAMPSVYVSNFSCTSQFFILFVRVRSSLSLSMRRVCVCAVPAVCHRVYLDRMKIGTNIGRDLYCDIHVTRLLLLLLFVVRSIWFRLNKECNSSNDGCLQFIASSSRDTTRARLLMQDSITTTTMLMMMMMAHGTRATTTRQNVPHFIKLWINIDFFFVLFFGFEFESKRKRWNGTAQKTKKQSWNYIKAHNLSVQDKLKSLKLTPIAFCMVMWVRESIGGCQTDICVIVRLCAD